MMLIFLVRPVLLSLSISPIDGVESADNSLKIHSDHSFIVN